MNQSHLGTNFTTFGSYDPNRVDACGDYLAGWDLIPKEYSTPVEYAFWTWFFYFVRKFIQKTYHGKRRIYRKMKSLKNLDFRHDQDDFNDFYNSDRLHEELKRMDNKVFLSLDETSENLIRPCMSDELFQWYSKNKILHYFYATLEDGIQYELKDKMPSQTKINKVKQVSSFQGLFDYSIDFKFDKDSGKMSTNFEFKKTPQINGPELPDELTQPINKIRDSIKDFTIGNVQRDANDYFKAALSLL